MKTKLKLSLAAIAYCVGTGTAMSVASAGMTPQRHAGISYVSGGIGEAERQSIKQMSSEYPLQLVFVTLPTGQYLADVKLQIRNAQDKVVLDAVSDGPYFLAKMPSGQYRITAEVNGRVKRQVIQVTGRSQRVVFGWNEVAA